MRKAYHLQSGGGGRPHTSRGREKERRRVAAHLMGLLPQIMSSKPVSGSKHHYADGAGRVTKESRGGLGPIKAACVCPGRTAHSLQVVRNMMQTAWDDNAKQREKLDSKALAFVAEQQSAAAAGVVDLAGLAAVAADTAGSGDTAAEALPALGPAALAAHAAHGRAQGDGGRGAMPMSAAAQKRARREAHADGVEAVPDAALLAARTAYAKHEVAKAEQGNSLRRRGGGRGAAAQPGQPRAGPKTAATTAAAAAAEGPAAG